MEIFIEYFRNFNYRTDKALCYSSDDEDEKIKEVVDAYDPNNKKWVYGKFTFTLNQTV